MIVGYLEDLSLENFNLSLIENGWAQTITSSYIPTGKTAPKKYHEICLGDGDKLPIAENILTN